MTAAAASALSVALGAYPHTAPVRDAADPRFTFETINPINRAFAPMAREGRYDISEMALMTFLQARAYGRPLVPLPLAVAARFQEGALLCRTDDATIHSPDDLRGKRVGVRAYSQTTGVWIRGVLGDEHGLACGDMRWVTFEGAHVADYVDPPWTTRAPVGTNMLSMLRDRQLDAVIVGNEVPDDPGLRTVFPDPGAAALQFRARHGFMPVNHLVVVREAALSQELRAVKDFVQALVAGFRGRVDLPIGCAALAPAVALALRYMTEQGLLPHPLAVDRVWDGLPLELHEPMLELSHD